MDFEKGKERAFWVLQKCSTKYGLYASGDKDGYTQVWSRDSNISLMGATLLYQNFKDVFKKSLQTLAKAQSSKGQIPNAVDFIGSIDKPATFATIDSSLWFILGEHFYKKRFGPALWKLHKKKISAALQWVQYQDAGEDLLPEQLPTSDWQDCFPHKYGHTINTQALYYAALKATGAKSAQLKKFKKAVDYYLWSDDLGYFLPWHWKDHGKYSEHEHWFDSLGNVLAIVFGLASKAQANSILDYIERKNIATPYPLRSIYPPIKEGDSEWKDYFNECLAKNAHSYLNGGIWPFIGAFYICALLSANRKEYALQQFRLLSSACSLGKPEWEFNEWISPITKMPAGGRFQAWSAGGYLLAYAAIRRGKNPLEI